jgi:uncharacterized membrane protein
MIQRIQTLFLLAAIGLHALLLKVSFFSAKINGNEFQYSAWRTINTGSAEVHINVFHIILQFALMALTLFTIFRFSNRPQQMKCCIYLLLGTLLSLVFSMYTLFTTNYTEYHFGIGTYLLSLIIIIYISAYYFIKKDDDLVRSADRLRE